MNLQRTLALFFDVALLLAIGLGIFRGTRRYARKKAFFHEWALQSALVIVSFLPWLLSQWPGLYIIDSLNAYTFVREYKFFSWSSSLYSLYLMGLREFSANPGMLCVFQVLAVAAIAGYIGAFASSKGVNRWLCRLAIVFFSQLPLNPAMTIFINRDPLFSWCHVLTALFFPWYHLRFGRGTAPSTQVTASYAMLAVCTGFLRVEAMALLPLLAVLLYFVLGWSPKAVGKFVLFCASLSLSFYLLLYYEIDTPLMSDAYSVVSMMNPLGEIIHENYRTDSREKDRVSIDHAINYELLWKNHDPYDVPASYVGAVRRALTHDEYLGARHTFWKIIFDNPGLFLKNRAEFTWALMGFSPRIFYQSDDLLNDDPQIFRMRTNLGFEKAPFTPLFHESTLPFLLKIEGAPWSRVAFASNAWALLFSFFSLLFARRIPACAAASSVLLARLAIVALSAPSTQFKYVYGLYLYSFFFPLFAYAEWKQRYPIRAEAMERKLSKLKRRAFDRVNDFARSGKRPDAGARL